mgnify:CR=1 FL=1
MKIGIITFHNTSNYGAVLQAYALSRFLELSGHEVYFIDYKRKPDSGLIQNLTHRISIALKMLSTPSLVISYFRSKGKTGSKSTYLSTKSERNEKQNELFNEFRRKYFKMSELNYNTPAELKKNPPLYDAYIAGSDQIWGHGRTTFSDAYFLNFGPKNIRRVSYAPSFGSPILKKPWHKDLRKKISKFDYVSVREKSGAEIIKEVCNLEVKHVLDPTLLLKDYSTITTKIDLDPYLFIFKLKQRKELESSFKNLTSCIAKELKLNTITVDPMTVLDEKELCSIERFLGYIKSASFMITNSFHGTVFAIIHNINFICCPRTLSAEGQNDRMLGLLTDLDLSDRFFDFEMTTDYSQIINSEINWSEVNTRLERLRESSIKFLEDALL